MSSALFPTSRGMIVTVLHRIAGSPAAEGECFGDVAPGKYYADAVAWASPAGIVSGYGNNSFRPESESITVDAFMLIH